MSKNANIQVKSDLKIVCLDEMVDMLNEVSLSDVGSITIESKGMIDFGMRIYSKDRGNEWEVVVNSKTIDEMLYEQFIILDYALAEDPFSFDTLEIIGDIIWDESTNEFKISFGLNLEIVISVYDYIFEEDDEVEELEEDNE
ncbi:hypothetical protein [Clostridium scatologenes]|uniref:DNA-binding protein n=1 Tax=Clostridium scatologenes TaxID=1548 RepID=A0A0E3M8S2_CLOSL|nr:hypothetical protein [Clostridium scatologenes]AKA70172.1 DNA-binding protein [Clostridium scatologenes]